MTRAAMLRMLAVLCLALVPALALAAPPEPKGKLVYEDDFSDKTKSGLEDNLKATDYSRGFHAPGYYHLKDLKANEIHWSLFPKQRYTNLTFELDVFDNSDDFTGDVWQGVVVRAQDEAHFYAVLLNPRAGKYTVRKLDGAGKWSDLVAPADSKLIKSGAEINRLRVDADAASFTIYLNGEQLGTFSDAAYKQGGIGVIAANVDAVTMHMHFDNVKVYTTDAGAPVVGSSGGASAPSALPRTGAAETLPALLLASLAALLLALGALARRRA